MRHQPGHPSRRGALRPAARSRPCRGPDRPPARRRGPCHGPDGQHLRRLLVGDEYTTRAGMGPASTAAGQFETDAQRWVCWPSTASPLWSRSAAATARPCCCSTPGCHRRAWSPTPTGSRSTWGVCRASSSATALRPRGRPRRPRRQAGHPPYADGRPSACLDPAPPPHPAEHLRHAHPQQEGARRGGVRGRRTQPAFPSRRRKRADHRRGGPHHRFRARHARRAPGRCAATTGSTTRGSSTTRRWSYICGTEAWSCSPAAVTGESSTSSATRGG